MFYHRLPTAFVANDYLCAFLLAQGLKETTCAESQQGCRDFQQGEGSEATCITVDQANSNIELYAGSLLGHGYSAIPAAALLLLLTLEPGRLVQQHLFLATMTELSKWAWRGERLSELVADIEANFAHLPIVATPAQLVASSPTGKLPPLASQQTAAIN